MKLVIPCCFNVILSPKSDSACRPSCHVSDHQLSRSVDDNVSIKTKNSTVLGAWSSGPPGSTARRRKQNGFIPSCCLESLEPRQLLTQAVSLVADINDGPQYFSPQNFVSTGSTTFFTATTDEIGTELWRTDGTTAGPFVVRDIASGKDSSAPRWLTNVGGTLYFSAWTADSGLELWKSNGSTQGTLRVANIYPGSTGSDPSSLVNLNGTLVFSANDSLTGRELWTSDGTVNGTRQETFEPMELQIQSL